MVHLNAEQQAAVNETEKPVLVLAGPGTGKTAMMVQKYKHLVLDKGLDPERILITTFTRKATEELEERISSELQKSGYYSKIEVQSFHSFCLKLLQDHPSESQIPKDPPILDGLQLRRFLLENRDAFTWKTVPFVRWVDTPMQRLTQFMGSCMSAGMTPELAIGAAEAAVARAGPKELRKAEEYLDYAHNYGVALGLLRKRGIITYDTMLYDAVQLLEHHEDIRLTVQDNYDYLLVDEVQDNNGLQARLIELIAGGRGCITVVGDEDQGIYKFRGAERGILERFKAHFNPQRIDLYQNYRSSANIVNASKVVIEHNTERFDNKRLEAAGANAGNPALPSVTGYMDEEQEVLHLAARIAACIANGRKPSDIAVLYRSLNHKGRLLDELEARGIRYEITNVAQLLRLREVRDLWAWMATLSNPVLDNPAFERVLMGREVGLPIFELGPIQRRYYRIRDEAARAEGKDHGYMNLVDVVRDLDAGHVEDEARRRLRWLRHTIEKLSEKTRGLSALDTAYEVLGWLQPQRRHKPDDVRAQQVWANLGDFLQVIKDYEQTYPDSKGLAGFLDHLDYLDRQGAEFQERAPDESEDSVKILTAHRSKGLQWPVVFLPACNKNRFPGSNRGDWMGPILRPDADTASEHIEEERRVFFVAMTRAEQELHITFSRSIGGKERARSVFIDELVDGMSAISEHLEAKALVPAQSQRDVFEAARYESIHAAIPVQSPEPAELEHRMAQIVQAVGELWSNQADPVAVASALGPLGYKPLPDEPAEDTPRGRIRLSASALNTYADCPRKFQFQYVLRIPQKISASAVAGSNVHRALEVFHKRHKEDWRQQPLETLLTIYDEVFAEGRFESDAEAKQWRERDTKILAAYLDSETLVAGEPTHFEVPFQLTFEDLDAEFYGFIDRVDEHADGTVEIIDYKTGSRKTANKIVGEDFQVPLYVSAFEHMGRTVKAGTLYWMREAGDGTGPIERMRMERKGEGKPKGEFTDAAMAAFKGRVAGAVDGIRAGQFTEEPNDFACKLCDYRLLCPAFER